MSRLQFAETTATHLYEIITNASKVTWNEIVNAGTTPWALLRDLNFLVKSGNKAVTLLADGEPVFVFGHGAGTIHNSRINWFVAKEKYYELGAAGVRAARRYLRTVKSSWPGTTFESYTFSDHPDVERWFRALGFVRAWPLSVPPKCRVFHLTA